MEVFNDFDTLVFYYESYKNKKQFNCTCESCKMDFTMVRMTIYRMIKSNNTKILCKSCKISQTKNAYTDKRKNEISSKRKATNLKRYGYENTFQDEKVKQNSSNNKVKRMAIIKKSIKEKYGVDNIMQLKEVQKKAIETAIKNDPGFKKRVEKIQKTNLERRGHKSNFQDDDFHEKSIEKQLKLYGRPIYSRTYVYNDICFDSSWELAYYIWLTDSKIPFQYQPKADFKYIGDDGKEHNYYPDFFVLGEYQEIKGNQFFNENNEPYDNINKKFWWEKYNCAIDNNVHILRWSDLKPIIEYVSNTYGKNYIKSFKVSVKNKN